MNYSPDLTMATLKMVLSLAVVLALVWGLSRLAKKKLPMANGGGKTGLIQVLESQYLGIKKSVTLVKVPGSVLVLGVSPDRVSLLSKIEEPELLSGVEADIKAQQTGLSFRAQLRRFTGAKLAPDSAVEKGIES
ncbi:MAG: flagellar biosynthetic protein FliO [Desulfobacteraceae bacterium]|jgi:flagellar biosynthetic protein FliO